jgi:hypothetical protein
MLKWWFIFFMRGIAIGGPFDGQEECLTALRAEIAKPIIDPGFDNARASGLCFQAVRG